MYTSRLRKYKHAEEHALARKRLVEEFGLSDNPDVLFSFAEALYISFRWADCFAITTRYVHPYSYVPLPDIASSAQKNSRTTSRSRTHNAITYCMLTSLIPPAFKIIYFSTWTSRQGTRIAYKLACSRCLVHERWQIPRSSNIFQVNCAQSLSRYFMEY